MKRAAPTPWPPASVRAWVERHGGNVTACARRLDVARPRLTGWLSERPAASTARDLPRYIQAHMQTLDGLQAWLARRGDEIAADARAEMDAVLRGEVPRED